MAGAGGMAYGESSYGDGEGCGEEQDLSVTGQEGEEPVQRVLVVHGEQLVRLVQHQHVTLAGVGYPFLQQVQQATWRGYNDMD